ncbi:hypothetical protein G6011_03372 [Alternaria panax]|uniref:Uncharacterized protein n=1 Tax=Alternaria panax TaxID=48097 RepID=A0AAD4IEY7_9PLEO|nr:hypothetical protein G6011_03372 [Alternaria panax]
MLPLNIVTTLTGFTATAFGSAVSQDIPQEVHECAKYNKGVTTCSPYTNEIYQCNELGWDWVATCYDRKSPCVNGACVLSPTATESRATECDEGQKRCLTFYNRGHDGIQICKNGQWKLLDPCSCNRDPEPQCRPIVSRDIAGPHQCTEGEQKCMLQNENGNGGTLFSCNNGFWKTHMHCRPSERCHDSPGFSTCSWLDAAAVAVAVAVADDDDTFTTHVRKD